MKNYRSAIHCFLFAVYPILFLFSYNIGQVAFSQILLPITLSLVFTGIIYLSLLFVLKDGDKTGLIVTIFLILFFFYGHILQQMEIWDIKHFNKGKHLINLSAAIFFVSTYFIITAKKKLHNLTKIINFVALSLTILTVINIGYAKLKPMLNSGNIKTYANNGTSFEIKYKGDSPAPDIYYIILDAYASSGILEDIYKFDNSEFVEYLTNKGFYVAVDSCSNYATTFFSLASTLNMEYVNNIAEQLGEESDDRSIFYKMIRDNQVSRILKSMNYKIINFSSGWAGTAYISNSDMRFDCGIIDEFQLVLIRSTMLDYFVTRRLIRPDARTRIQNMFSKLGEVCKIEGPKFVFAHFICPHPPFLFNENGEDISTEDLAYDGRLWSRNDLYLSQLKYVNKKVRILIDKILSDSKTPPIIILQADHGTASMGRPIGHLKTTDKHKQIARERLHIFNAYYLPEEAGKLLYSDISPVNSFRLIFNACFGADYELLEDRSYYSSYIRPYIITEVTDIVKTRE